MEELSKLDQERHGGKLTGIASNEMCTFLIMNISSLQLIPVSLIQLTLEEFLLLSLIHLLHHEQNHHIHSTDLITGALFTTLVGIIASVILAGFLTN